MLPALRIGGLYEARVALLRADGRVLLEIGGEQLTARCAASLREGERVGVEVVSLWPELVLRVQRPARQELPAGAERSAVRAR